MAKSLEAGGVVIKLDALAPKYFLITAKDKPDEWIFPKGHIEKGEGAQAAAVREVKEEAGVEAQTLGRIGEIEFQHQGQTIQVEFYLLKYLGDAASGEQRQKRWCTYGEALNLLTFSDTRRILRMANALIDKIVERL